MARIFTIDRAVQQVAPSSFGIPNQSQSYVGHGWQIKMDQDVDYDAVVKHGGPMPVKVILAKPGGFASPSWDTFHEVSGTTYTWHPENEDLFVLALIQDSGAWKAINGAEGYSSNQLLSEGSPASGVVMSWTTQNLIFTIRAH